MLKYAKVINKKTKQCEVGIGTNAEFYKSIGMTQLDVEQAYNGNWYVAGYVPQKPAPTYEEIDKAREEYRKEHIDSKTAMRSRKMANGTWTEEDEAEYLELDRKVTEYIEAMFPYPAE